jgi:proteasome lid subunit RPN8/RPN11
VPLPDPAFVPPTLHLSGSQYRTIVAHCYDGLPDEACGLLAGSVGTDLEPTGSVHTVYPCRNADASARTYTVEGQDYLHADSDARSHDVDLIGVWHSHTHSDAYPSDTDVRRALEPFWVYVIVSLKHAEPVLRAYRIRADVVAECEVVVADS